MEEDVFDDSFLRVQYTHQNATDDMLKRYTNDAFTYQMDDRVARLNLTADGKAYVQTVDLVNYEPSYKIERDYGPAQEYIENYDRYLETGRLEIPRPFSPGYKRYRHVNQYVFDTFRKLCVLTGSDPSEETKFGRWYHQMYSKAGDKPFKGFVHTNRVREGIGVAFNPFSAYGSVLLTEINYENDRVHGTYRFDDKTYDYIWYFYHGCNVYNPDVWTKRIAVRTPEFQAFSIVSEDVIQFSMPKLRKTNYVIPPYLIPVTEDTVCDAGRFRPKDRLDVIGFKVPGVTYLYRKEEDFMIPVKKKGLCSLRSGRGVSYVVQVRDKMLFNKIPKVKYRDKIVRGADFYRQTKEVRELPDNVRAMRAVDVPDVTRQEWGQSEQRINLYRMAVMDPAGDLEECEGGQYAKYESEETGCMYYIQVGKCEQSRVYNTPTGKKLRVSDQNAGWYDDVQEGELTECNNFSFFVPEDFQAHVEVMRVVASLDVLTKVKLQEITRDKFEKVNIAQATFDVVLEEPSESFAYSDLSGIYETIEEEDFELEFGDW